MASGLAAFALTIVVMVILIGVFVYQGTTGAISIDATSNTTLAAVSTNVGTVVASFWTAVTSVTGFIVIGAILAVVGGIAIFKGKGGAGL